MARNHLRRLPKENAKEIRRMLTLLQQRLRGIARTAEEIEAEFVRNQLRASS